MTRMEPMRDMCASIAVCCTAGHAWTRFWRKDHTRHDNRIVSVRCLVSRLSVISRLSMQWLEWQRGSLRMPFAYAAAAAAGRCRRNTSMHACMHGTHLDTLRYTSHTCRHPASRLPRLPRTSLPACFPTCAVMSRILLRVAMRYPPSATPLTTAAPEGRPAEFR